MSRGVYSVNPEIARNLFVLDVQESARGLAVDQLYQKVFWANFGAKRYIPGKVEFTTSERAILLACKDYIGYPLPRFMKMVVDLFGENFLIDNHRASAFSSCGHDIFLLDYCLFLSSQMFEQCEWPSAFVEWALSIDDASSDNTGVPLPRLAIAGHASSSELQAQFDLKSVEGCLGLLGWILRWKLPSFKGLHLPRSLVTWLQQPAITNSFVKEVGLTRFHEVIYLALPEQDRWLDLSKKEEALSYSAWMLLFGPAIDGFEMPSWVWSALGFVVGSVGEINITRFMLALWSHEYGTASSFPYGDTSTLDDFVQYASKREKEIRNRWLSVAGAGATSSQPSCTPIIGANLIGWPRTEIGIGEDVRCAAIAMNLSEVPFVIIDAAPLVPPRPVQVDNEVSKWIGGDYQFNTDIVFLDPSTQYRYYSFEILKNKLIDRTVIGVCPWELPQWPKELGFVFEHMDYFWAATEYIKDAISPNFPDRIAIARPAVIVPEQFWKKPDLSGNGPFKFITVFDGLSSIHRKNPFAVIRAFQNAFPGQQDVQLVVKMMNVPANTDESSLLLNYIANDPRIKLVRDMLPQNELWDLVSSCHVFVSLHRAEGFGRNIAEAMLLGRPVICSAFSGNLDFCKENNSFLVSGDLVAVEPGAYSNATGQYWFDASVEHAAQCMKSAYEDYSAALCKAANGRYFMQTHHSYKAVGEQYVRLLSEMGCRK